MQSSIWRRYGVLAACLTLAVASVALVKAAPNNAAAANHPPDPPGTTVYMDQLRKLFDKWDVNSDEYLDKEELAKAFRGHDAKPYDYQKDASTDSSKDNAKDTTAAKKPDYKKYPDYKFLMKVDQDNDGQISRDEFMDWARGYAVHLKEDAAQEKKIVALEAKLQRSRSAKEAGRVERELTKEQAKLDKMNAKWNDDEKAVKKHLKSN